MRSWTARLLLLALCASVPVALWAILTNARGQHLLYPEWSSLRSDEKGTSVWYESLERDPHLRVSRSFRPLSEVREQDAMLLLAGTPLGYFAGGADSLLTMCEGIAKAGNRVILALDSEGTPKFLRRPEPLLDFKKHGLNPVWEKDKLRFKPGGAWKTLRDEKSGPETIERAFGKGSLVLAASSEALSNAGLARRRDTALLMSLTGPARTILFDESHLGIVETGTIMGLARHYRLQGFLGGLLVLCLLFVWRNWTAFPRRAEPAVATLDPLDGLAGLLARALPQDSLIAECVRVRTQVERSPQSRSDMVKAAELAGTKDPVELFCRIQSAIARKQLPETES